MIAIPLVAFVIGPEVSVLMSSQFVLHAFMFPLTRIESNRLYHPVLCHETRRNGSQEKDVRPGGPSGRQSLHLLGVRGVPEVLTNVLWVS